MSGEPDVAFIFDTDALAQILMAQQQNLLNILRQDFGVACFIMMEVEVELRSKPKFSGLIRPALEKALRSGWLKLLTASDLEQLACLQSQGPVTLADIRVLGAEYALYVQTGEAYTHAAATLLGTPAISNDLNAIRVLESNGKTLPPTVLRSFDLFGLMHLEEYLDIKAVEQIRSLLLGYSEWVPAPMRNSSFVLGLGNWDCRLSTSMATSGSGNGWAENFYLKRKTQRPSQKTNEV